MNRNVESHFSSLPQVDIERSRFDRSSRLLTTANAGDLFPIYLTEVLPGDTVTLDVSSLVRMSTPVFPVMDSSSMDTYFFYVPSRILWSHWKQFMGENTNSYWAPSVEYSVPQLVSPSDGFDKGSLADYFGLPINTKCSVSALPFRAYVMIWNEFFRDQNTMTPAYFYDGDSNINGERFDSFPNWSSNEAEVVRAAFDFRLQNALKGACTLPVCKYHDYFTSCLPAPQKGPAVDIPLFNDDVNISTLNGAPLQFSGYNGQTSFSNTPLYVGSLAGGASGVSLFTENSNNTIEPLLPSNLAINQASVASATINQLRQAFQIQRLYEKDARGGTRYRELLKAHFGVTSPDSRMQVPEFLGGRRVPINIDQVLQTSSTDDISPQGNTAAFSLTTDVSDCFTKSFTEHGYIIGVACFRTDHTYQQGIERMWSRTKRFDYYWPALANLGEQAVLKKEIFATGTEFDNEAFGYQEAWADYRYKPSIVTGAFRSGYNGTLDSWHYADYYDPAVTSAREFVIQSSWLQETKNNLDRTLAVTSRLEDQFLCNFYFKAIFTRPMPLYSIPGLIDHN